MSFKFSQASETKLSTVEEPLRLVARKALAYGVIDATITEGVRDKERQDMLFKTGKSKVKWPNSKHNIQEPGGLAKAIDAPPFVNGAQSWNSNHCLVWAGLMLAAAAELKIKIKWGGNWDMDGEPVTDQKFQDLVHFELV